MDRTALQIERRQFPRHRISSRQRVSYRAGWLGIRREAWVYDVSSRGLSLLVDAGQAPRIGQEIELRPHRTRMKLNGRVVRIDVAGGGRLLVGCALNDPPGHRELVELAA